MTAEGAKAASVARGKVMDLQEALKVLNVEANTPWAKVTEVRLLRRLPAQPCALHHQLQQYTRMVAANASSGSQYLQSKARHRPSALALQAHSCYRFITPTRGWRASAARRLMQLGAEEKRAQAGRRRSNKAAGVVSLQAGSRAGEISLVNRVEWGFEPACS